jgi:hypothetical protein
LNADADSNNAVLTFGNTSGNQSFRFDNTAQRFVLTKGLNVVGNISGSTLTVSSSGVSINNVYYRFPNTASTANSFLKNNGSGVLSWSTSLAGGGSGSIVGLAPEFKGGTYFSSGASSVGQLNSMYDASAKENHYRWTSTKGTVQNYWISVRVRVPNNFAHWDSAAPIQMRYRTGAASAATNSLNVKLLDTAGVDVPLTGGSALANTSFTTASVTGPNTSGTYTVGSFITLLFKLETTSAGNADLGIVNLKWATTTP